MARTSLHVCLLCKVKDQEVKELVISINQSINQTFIAPISPAKPGSVARQPNQCSTAKLRKQFRNINRPWGVTVSMGERPSQRVVSSDVS